MSREGHRRDTNIKAF